jgi:elongation factor G
MTTDTKQLSDIKKLRNIGIIAHIDAGKTTTTERILFYTGVTHSIGEVHEGDTEMDWMVQEKERGITITSAATLCEWRKFKINIIDTPGHVDFTAEVERSLRVLDGVVTIFSGVDMVESQTEKVWRQADKYDIPRMAFINKLDRPGSQYVKCMEQMEERLGTVTLPLQVPAGEGDELEGMIDLISMKLLVWDSESKGLEYTETDIPEKYQELAVSMRGRMLETVAEVDDKLMEKYLAEEEISAEELKAAIRVATVEKGLTPVLGGTALKNVGVQPLLDAIVDYLPSPLDRGSVEGESVSVAGEVIKRSPTPDEPLTSMAFKLATDEYTGKLIFVRVYSGVLEKGSHVLNSSTGKKERIGRIFQMHANKRQEVDSITAGNIGAIVGPKDVTTGDTLCDLKSPILLEKIEFPEPVMFAAIEPKSDKDDERLSESLGKLVQEDPTFHVRVDPETNQTVIGGMGELHLEILHDRLTREFNANATMGRPQVAYKETLMVAADIDEKFIKQSGGRGQYGHVCVLFEPLDRGGGFEFVDKVKGGSVPREYIPAVKSGIAESMGSGPLAGFPVVDIRATLHYGSSHDVDSSEIAFKIVASMALKSAFQEAKAELLEPIMEGEVVTPTEYIGDIVGDLHTRRGEIKGFDVHGNTQIIHVVIPLAETFGYATVVRSLTQGRATYQFKFSHYDVVPAHIKEEVLEGKK